jgi:hypothetical protein
LNTTLLKRIQTTPLEQLLALDTTVTVGTALTTCTGYTVSSYDGTTAWFEGHERYIPPTGGPYLPPGPGDQYARIEISIHALPVCDGVRRIVVFPTAALVDVRRHTWFHSDVYGGY